MQIWLIPPFKYPKKCEFLINYIYSNLNLNYDPYNPNEWLAAITVTINLLISLINYQ
jgi:hypothetical protein